MPTVELHPAARRDFDESIDWYAERSIAVAIDSADAVDAALASIASDPDRFATVDGLHREARVRRFPFRIIFRNEPDLILVVAIAHASRRPGYWIGRS